MKSFFFTRRFMAPLLCSAGAFVVLLSPALQAGPIPSGKTVKQPVIAPEDSFTLPGTFNAGFKTSDVYSEGHISVVVPLWSTLGTDSTLGGNYLFLEPYTSLGEEGELANSVGLGWRYFFNNQPIDAVDSKPASPVGFLTEGFYVGASLFVDNLRTQFDNDFWQFGFGAEVGTRYLTLRGNYYLPFDGSQKLAERNVDIQKFTTTSQSRSTRMVNDNSAGIPFATGNSLQQDLTFGTSALTTTRTTRTNTTVTTITSLFEEGMEGWDAEIQYMIPGLDEHLEVSLIGGYYSFDNQPFGPQRGGSGTTEGWKAGLEIRPVPAVILTGMWYEDEGLTGSDWVAGVRLQIPLGKEWKDAFKPRRRHLIERLAEPVARQNAAIKTSLSVEQDQDVEQQSTTTTAVSRRIITQSTQRITIAEDLIFVNNGGPVGNGIAQAGAIQAGTAELPFNTIQKGADHAGNKNAATKRIWTVYTQGAGVHGGFAYNESVTISGSTKFTSSAVPIVSYGQIFGTGDYPVVKGGFAGMQKYFLTGEAVPASVSISGYDIRGGYNHTLTKSKNIPTGHIPGNKRGIYLDNISSVELKHNIISGTEMGVFAENEQNMQVNISGNTFVDNTLFGLALFSEKDINGVISKNIANRNGFGGPSLLGSLFPGMPTGGLPLGGLPIGSLPIGSIPGFPSLPGMPTPPTLPATPNIPGLANPAKISGIGGIGALALGNFNAEVSNNIANGNSIVGIVVGGVADTTGNIFGNSVSRNIAGLAGFAGRDFTGNIYGNKANENLIGVLGISIRNFTGSIYRNNTSGNLAGLAGVAINDFTGNIRHNTARGDWLGIAGFAMNNFDGNISNNVATSNYYLGILAGSGRHINGNISGNIANGSTIAGMVVFTAKNLNGNVSGNVTNNNYLIGSMIATQGKLKGNVDGNTANNNGYIGMMVNSYDNIDGNISNNVARNNGINNISISAYGLLKGDISKNDTSNTVAGKTAMAGLIIYADDNISGSIINNKSSHTAGAGIMLSAYNKFNGNFTGNTANNNTGPGIIIDVNAGFNGNMSGNTANQNGYSGIMIDANTIVGNVTGNTANRNRDAGIVINTNGVFRGDLTNNTTSFNGDDGIYTDIGGNFTGNFSGNVAESNANHGHNLYTHGNFKGDVSGNTYKNNTADGLYFGTHGKFTGNITNNTVNNVAVISYHGLHFDIGSDYSGNITGNTTSRNHSGILLEAARFMSGSSFTGNSSNNNTIGFETDIGTVQGGITTSPNTTTGNGTDVINNDAVLLP